MKTSEYMVWLDSRFSGKSADDEVKEILESRPLDEVDDKDKLILELLVQVAECQDTFDDIKKRKHTTRTAYPHPFYTFI